MRATVSVALPAACGTMSLIGLSGYSAAAPVANVHASSNSQRRRPRISSHVRSQSSRIVDIMMRAMPMQLCISIA
jgi:hypothetical protein